ncbi:hypothetical protein H4582DRAFT_2016360 [Lactarius indigo]|nr:hypothetical protein H4582DRAFT_2016360 [Lactarius indigo]
MPASLYSPSDDVSPTSVSYRDTPLVDECTGLHICPPVVAAPPIAPDKEGRGRSRNPRRLSPASEYYRYRYSPSPTRRGGSRSSSQSLPTYRRRRRRQPARRRVTPPEYLETGAYRLRPLRSPSPSYIPPSVVWPPQHPPIAVMPHPPPPVAAPMSLPSPSPWYVKQTTTGKQPVDILTFRYNKNMAFALAAETYDKAIDTVVELWPELREVERDRIHLLVTTGSGHLARVPRMTWSAVLCDLPRYEIVHVHVKYTIGEIIFQFVRFFLFHAGIARILQSPAINLARTSEILS